MPETEESQEAEGPDVPTPGRPPRTMNVLTTITVRPGETRMLMAQGLILEVYPGPFGSVAMDVLGKAMVEHYTIPVPECQPYRGTRVGTVIREPTMVLVCTDPADFPSGPDMAGNPWRMVGHTRRRFLGIPLSRAWVFLGAAWPQRQQEPEPSRHEVEVGSTRKAGKKKAAKKRGKKAGKKKASKARRSMR